MRRYHKDECGSMYEDDDGIWVAYAEAARFELLYRSGLTTITELESEIHEIRIAYDKLFDEAAAGFAERDSRILKLESLVRAVSSNGELDLGTEDWFEIRDSLFKS